MKLLGTNCVFLVLEAVSWNRWEWNVFFVLVGEHYGTVWDGTSHLLYGRVLLFPSLTSFIFSSLSFRLSSSLLFRLVFHLLSRLSSSLLFRLVFHLLSRTPTSSSGVSRLGDGGRGSSEAVCVKERVPFVIGVGRRLRGTRGLGGRSGGSGGSRNVSGGLRLCRGSVKSASNA